MGYARIQEEPFQLDAVLADLGSDRTGGVTLYVGTVRREEAERRIDVLEYEAYPEMALRALEALRRDAIDRFELVDAVVIHRTGRLVPGAPILVVALAGRHRTETFDGVRYFMDRLKESVPIWKKEEGAEGSTWILGPENRRVKS